jgi:hypothetical protein
MASPSVEFVAQCSEWRPVRHHFHAVGQRRDLGRLGCGVPVGVDMRVFRFPQIIQTAYFYTLSKVTPFVQLLQGSPINELPFSGRLEPILWISRDIKWITWTNQSDRKSCKNRAESVPDGKVRAGD